MKKPVRQLTISCAVFASLLLAGALLVWLFMNTLKRPKLFQLEGEAAERARHVAIIYNDFDALILGSSMSSNFFCSNFDANFHTNSLKLAESGMPMKSAMQMASFALFQKKGHLKYVLVDVTSPSFTAPSTNDILKQNNLNYDLTNLDDYFSFDTIRYALYFFLGRECKPVERDDFGAWYKDLDEGETPIMSFAKKNPEVQRPA